MLTIGVKTKTACFLGWIVIHLSFIGHFIEARDCAFNAVLILRLLVAENPDSHTPNLAHCLASLGGQLSNLNWHEVSNLNRHEESLGATQESITLYRSLVDKNPASYTPNLVSQLGNLGVWLLNLNRHEELLGATQESITLYQSLIDKNPASYTPDLVSQLGNLGVWLSNLNWHEESLGATQQSITLY